MASSSTAPAQTPSRSAATTTGSSEQREEVMTREQLRARVAQADRELACICPFDSEAIASLITRRAYATGTELRSLSVRMGWHSEAVRTLLLTARSLMMSEPERTDELARRASTEATRAGLKWELFEAQRVLANARYQLGDVDMAEQLARSAIEGFTDLCDGTSDLKCLWLLRSVEFSRGRDDRELMLLTSMLEHPALESCEVVHYYVHCQIARVLTNHRPDDPRIEEHIAAADRLTAASSNPLSRICYYQVRVNHLVSIGEYQTALAIADECLRHARAHHGIEAEAFALSLLASCYNELGDKSMNHECLSQSLELGRVVKNHSAVALSLLNLGIMKFDDDPEGAQRDLEDAVFEARRDSNAEMEMLCEKTLADKLESMGRPEEAMPHLKRYIELQSGVRADAFENALRAIALQQEVARTERAIDELQEQREFLQHELEKQASDAANKSAALADQACVIRDVHSIFHHVLTHNSTPREIIAELRRRFERIPLPELQWQQLSDEFIRMFPDFLTNLRERCPTISKTEERVCCLIRLNLSTHDIASLLNITERGVETCRLRIRRKAKLTNRTSLQEYLSTV